MDAEKLLRFWDKVVTGESFQDGGEVNNEPDSLKDLLYKKTLRVMPKVVSAIEIKSVDHSQSTEKVLKEIFEMSCKIDPEPWSFFPQRIMQTKKATCAGNTLLVNYLLNEANIDFEYGRPQGHSINFVYLDSDTWWVDGTNGVLDKIDISDNVVGGVRVRVVESGNARIPYKLVRVMPPRDVVINIFGNMDAMKNIALKGKDKYAVQIMDQYEDEINEIDFGKWLFYLYPEHMQYTIQNKEFQNEVDRIRKIQE